MYSRVLVSNLTTVTNALCAIVRFMRVLLCHFIDLNLEKIVNNYLKVKSFVHPRAIIQRVI